MRELTQQEIDNAPEWATHYKVVKSVTLQNHPVIFVACEDEAASIYNYEPVPRKPFDISEHEFSDKDIFNHFITKDKSRINFDFDSDLMPSDTIGFNKDDAIAIAKHFKLI